MRHAGADGDEHVAEVVHDRMKRRQLGADFFAELVFVTGNGGSLDEFLEVACQVSRDFWLRRALCNRGKCAKERKDQGENGGKACKIGCL